ncbi:MAG: hypothetical protein EOP84_29515 [Verrucomicrobiaceae bacterium]|nr:MAG: hypothetical protein EOP84_29515 [Verrucomicrobiaceae bacterium]
MKIQAFENGSGGWDRTDYYPSEDQSLARRESAIASGGGRSGDPLAPDLARVVDIWPKLNGALKLAILAIVDASGAGKEEAL